MSKKNDQTVTSRRKTLKTALAGSAIAASIPAAWVKPTVSSVVLPGHAATTDGGGDPGTGTTMAPAVCDPAVLDAITMLNARYFYGEGGSIQMSIGDIPSQLTNIALVNPTGALSASETFGFFTEGSPGEGRIRFEGSPDDGAFPESINLSLTFDDQPAPCYLSTDLEIINS